MLKYIQISMVFRKKQLAFTFAYCYNCKAFEYLVRIFDAHVRQNALCCGEDRSHQDHREVKK